MSVNNTRYSYLKHILPHGHGNQYKSTHKKVLPFTRDQFIYKLLEHPVSWAVVYMQTNQANSAIFRVTNLLQRLGDYANSAEM